MSALLTRRELADLLKVSVSTIDRLCRERKLRYSRVGSRKRFSPDDVASFIDSRSFGHPQPLSRPASTI